MSLESVYVAGYYLMADKNKRSFLGNSALSIYNQRHHQEYMVPFILNSITAKSEIDVLKIHITTYRCFFAGEGVSLHRLK